MPAWVLTQLYDKIEGLDLEFSPNQLTRILPKRVSQQETIVFDLPRSKFRSVHACDWCDVFGTKVPLSQAEKPENIGQGAYGGPMGALWALATSTAGTFLGDMLWAGAWAGAI